MSIGDELEVEPGVDEKLVTLYTTAKVAELCAVTSETVRNWLQDGKLKGIRLENQWRVKYTDLMEFLNERYGNE